MFNIKFNVHGSVHRSNILVYKSQQDAQVTEYATHNTRKPVPAVPR